MNTNQPIHRMSGKDYQLRFECSRVPLIGDLDRWAEWPR